MATGSPWSEVKQTLSTSDDDSKSFFHPLTPEAMSLPFLVKMQIPNCLPFRPRSDSASSRALTRLPSLQMLLDSHGGGSTSGPQGAGWSNQKPVENWKASDLRMLPTSAAALGWPPRCLDLSSKGTAVEAAGRDGDLPGRRRELPFLTTSLRCAGCKFHEAFKLSTLLKCFE